MLWKNHNNFIFEEMLLLALDTMGKIQEDVNQWFQAQEMERSYSAIEVSTFQIPQKSWSPPHISWLKCNIGSSWNKRKLESGASWMLRNSDGKVILHGRRSFSSIDSNLKVDMASWLWSIESIKNLKVPKVFFVVESKDLIGAITRPSAWHSYKHLKSWPFWIISPHGICSLK